MRQPCIKTIWGFHFGGLFIFFFLFLFLFQPFFIEIYPIYLDVHCTNMVFAYLNFKILIPFNPLS